MRQFKYAWRDSNNPPETRQICEIGTPTARQTAHFDHNLQRVIDAWPTLPEHLKAGILALIETAN